MTSQTTAINTTLTDDVLEIIIARTKEDFLTWRTNEGAGRTGVYHAHHQNIHISSFGPGPNPRATASVKEQPMALISESEAALRLHAAAASNVRRHRDLLRKAAQSVRVSNLENNAKQELMTRIIARLTHLDQNGLPPLWEAEQMAEVRRWTANVGNARFTLSTVQDKGVAFSITANGRTIEEFDANRDLGPPQKEAMQSLAKALMPTSAQTRVRPMETPPTPNQAAEYIRRHITSLLTPGKEL